MDSKWTLVIHDVGLDHATIWMGTLHSSLAKPARWRVAYTTGRETRHRYISGKSNWSRPFSDIGKRFYHVLTLKGLKPGRRYEVKFERPLSDRWKTHFREEWNALAAESRWETLATGWFDTLPRRIPKVGRNPFTIGLGSCFYDSFDGNSVSDAYSALYDKDEKHRPHLKFLTGDQVYLDIGLDSLSRDEGDIRDRIADDYANNWAALRGVLSRGGTWMLPDDHEYWNNYPFYKGLNPYLFMLRDKKVHDTWLKAARDGVKNVQRCPSVATFSVGSDLSFCVADLRSQRNQSDRFISHANFDKIVAWAEGLKSPGIFVSPQPLLVEPAGGEDWNLASYTKQYEALLQALASSGHDIVVLTGDVHFGRIASVPLGDGPGTLHEIISSPLSNLTWLNGLATNKPSKIRRFPTVSISGMRARPVTYPQRNWAVSTVNRLLDLRYPRVRTREHFMTLGFTRRPNRHIKLEVNAWLVRSFSAGKPKKDFTRGVTLDLK